MKASFIFASFFLASFASADTTPVVPPGLANANYAMVCEAREGGARKVIATSLDGIFGEQGGLETLVLADGIGIPGYVETRDEQDYNGHGVKRITIRFGNQYSLRAEMQPRFGEGPGRRVVGAGRGQLLRYDRILVGDAYCTISTTCADRRLCE